MDRFVCTIFGLVFGTFYGMLQMNYMYRGYNLPWSELIGGGFGSAGLMGLLFGIIIDAIRHVRRAPVEPSGEISPPRYINPVPFEPVFVFIGIVLGFVLGLWLGGTLTAAYTMALGGLIFGLAFDVKRWRARRVLRPEPHQY